MKPSHAKQGKARQGKARQGKARQGKARQSKATQEAHSSAGERRVWWRRRRELVDFDSSEGLSGATASAVVGGCVELRVGVVGA